MKIDLLHPREVNTPNKRGVFFFVKTFLLVLLIMFVTGIVFAGHGGTEQDVANSVGLFSTLRRLVPSSDRELNGENDDRVNFLLLGVGGEGHDGPELSDTIIFASFRPSTKEVGMLSIPRDLTLPIPGYNWRKINHINAFGEEEEDGYGPVFASEVIGDMLEQEIHYYVKVDFDGFEELIDELGGVNVYVERAFTDSTYPTDDYLTTTVNFEEGWQKMDGETALQFSRSRHGNNGEGSDFARAARQQKILLAVKDRVLSASTLLNPSRLSKVVSTLSSHMQTNMSLWEMVRLGSFVPQIDTEAITHHVLDESEDGPLYATSINGAYVLLPRNDDWSPVQRLAANVFSETDENVNITTPTDDVPPFVRLEIQNGTQITGFAFTVSQLLETEGFEVVKVGNAGDRSYTHTVIYDLTNGKKSQELETLRAALQAEVSMSAAGWIYTNEIVPTELSISNEPATEKATEEDIDFLIILGENTANLVLR